MVTKNKLLGKQIRKLRRQRELTQAELAEKVSVSTKYIQYIENAKRSPSLKLLYKIAGVIGVKVSELFTF